VDAAAHLPDKVHGTLSRVSFMPVRSSILAIAAGLTLVHVPAVLAHELQVERNDRQYAVQGGTLDALRADLKAKGVADDAGQFYSGTASTGLGYTYRFREQAGSCGVADVRVLLQISLTTPAWQGRWTASPALASAWDRYLSALQAHEAGHIEIARQAADQLGARVEVLSAPSCAALEVQAKALRDEATEALKRSHADYDRSTQHGRTQGALL
jgi:predicted secreted Zn-dependent protease